MVKKTVVLVTGGSGYLGQHLLLALSLRPNIELHGTSSGLETFQEDFSEICACYTIDMADSVALGALIRKVRPDVVVHAAAISSPRTCENDVERCMAVNAPIALIEHLPKQSAVVFLSTDQVYDGANPPYVEAPDNTAPVNAYGRSKLAFEKALTAQLPKRHVILRSSLIIGPPPPRRCNKPRSFLQDCARMLSSPEGGDFFSNEMRSAVAVDDVTAIITWAVEGGAIAHPGLYNMGGPGSLSRVDIASAVAAHLKLPLERVRSKPRPAGGPVQSPLDITMDSTLLQRVSDVPMRTLASTLPAAFATVPGKYAHRRFLLPMAAVFVLPALVALAAIRFAR